MKTVLIIIWIIVSLIFWMFATSTTVDGKHEGVAFHIKTLFFWLSVVFTYLMTRFILELE